MNRKIPIIAGIILVPIILFTLWFIWTIYTQKENPQFFPFNEPKGHYSIVTDDFNVSSSPLYMLKYEGLGIYSGPQVNGSISIFVGKTSYDLKKYVGREIVVTSGDFVSLTQQCIAGTCKNLPGRYAVVNIDGIKEVQSARP